MFLEESARMRERPPAELEPRVPERPRMDNVRPDLEGRRDVGRARRGGETDGVVEQSLRRADLDQGRRQPLEIRVERREARVLPVHARRDKGVGQPLQIPPLDERIDGAFAYQRRPDIVSRPTATGARGAWQLLARALEFSAKASVRFAPALSPPTAICSPGSRRAASAARRQARRREPPETDVRRQAVAGANVRNPLPVQPR